MNPGRAKKIRAMLGYVKSNGTTYASAYPRRCSGLRRVYQDFKKTVKMRKSQQAYKPAELTKARKKFIRVLKKRASMKAKVHNASS